MKSFDIIIIGSGISGIMAANEAVNNKLSVLLLEKGKEQSKRKNIISGWFGSNLYKEIKLKKYKTKHTKTVVDILMQVLPKKFFKDEIITLKSFDFLSNYFYNSLKKNICIEFNSEVESIEPKDCGVLITSHKNSYFCKKCIIASGKYSIEWLYDLETFLDLKLINNKPKLGVRIELSSDKHNIKEFKNDKFEICDIQKNCSIGNWDININNILSSLSYKNDFSKKMNFLVNSIQDISIEEVMRISEIINILSSGKIRYEKISDFLNMSSSLNSLQEFNFLNDAFNYLKKEDSNFNLNSYFYSPEITTFGLVEVNKKMQTNINNMYAIGECVNKINGFVEAAASGLVAINNINKELKNVKKK